MACEYCTGNVCKPIVDGLKFEISVTVDGYLFADFHSYNAVGCCEEKINFCPKCGRDLRGDE